MSQEYPGLRYKHVGYMDKDERFAQQTAKQIRQQNRKAVKCGLTSNPCNHINQHKKEVKTDAN